MPLVIANLPFSSFEMTKVFGPDVRSPSGAETSSTVYVPAGSPVKATVEPVDVKSYEADLSAAIFSILLDVSLYAASS